MVVIAAALLAHDAAGDIWHLQSPSTVKTEKGSELKLPPGYFLDEDTWKLRDAELKKLQDSDVRLSAENKSLRTSARRGDWLYAIGSALGIALGVYLAVK